MSRPLLTLLSLLLACGPGSVDTDTTATATTSGTTTSATTTSDATTSDATTSDATTSDATTSTADPPTTSTTEISTTAVATSTSTTNDTTSDSTTEGADIQYAAYFWAGGLDHIMIHRADFTNDRCATLHLARPGGGDPALEISVPPDFFPVNAAIADSSEGCLAGMPTGTSTAANGGAGSVEWPLDARPWACPPLIDLDLTLNFPPDQPWVPAQEPMLVTALPVQGCP